MQIVLLISTGLFTAVAAFLTWQCAIRSDAAREAHSGAVRERHKLAAMQGRVIALEQALESLAAQHRKLTGKFYAEKRERDEEPPPPRELSPSATDDAFACDNYRLAQQAGPGSEAASCECDYCVAKRIERDALRRQLPKGPHAARVRAIEAASRGQE